jgi:putative ABC transport system permease protein
VIRVKRDPFAVRNTVQRAIWSVDKTLPESNARTVDQILGEQVSEPRLYTILLGVFAVIALFLAVIGIYGLLNTIVNRHIHGMAIRVAIGAQSVDLIRLIVGQGLRISAVGLLIGLMATIGVTRVVKSLLFGVSPTDPLTLGAVALLLLIVGLLACYIPTRRAMTVDPMVALRCE